MGSSSGVQEGGQRPAGFQLSFPWGFPCTSGSFPCGLAWPWPAVPATARHTVWAVPVWAPLAGQQGKAFCILLSSSAGCAADLCPGSCSQGRLAALGGLESGSVCGSSSGFGSVGISAGPGLGLAQWCLARGVLPQGLWQRGWHVPSCPGPELVGVKKDLAGTWAVSRCGLATRQPLSAPGDPLQPACACWGALGRRCQPGGISQDGHWALGQAEVTQQAAIEAAPPDGVEVWGTPWQGWRGSGVGSISADLTLTGACLAQASATTTG